MSSPRDVHGATKGEGLDDQRGVCCPFPLKGECIGRNTRPGKACRGEGDPSNAGVPCHCRPCQPQIAIWCGLHGDSSCGAMDPIGAIALLDGVDDNCNPMDAMIHLVDGARPGIDLSLIHI